MLPASTRSDLAIDLLAGTEVTDAGDHLVVRTPGRPGYHWGNFLQVTRGDVDDAAGWVRRFEAIFPGARHLAVGLPREPDPAAWEALGLRADVTECLTAHRAPRPTPVPPGHRVAPLTSDADWAQRIATELAENEATGEYPPEEYAEFVAGQVAARRRLVQAGHAHWVGAWTHRGELAASMGIVVLEDGPVPLARYQSVLTHPAHRRRGLARHLLTVAAQWAGDTGAGEWVIVADAGSDAGRLYRAAGFAPGALAYGYYSSRWG
ncbi:GNAT family N-acetyltransferase [Kytococcus sedentarius]|uniref:GNAT family N-acetyltransferase n=1 Tax=Kytococcus sedentarius TaxID=1276 RepID=UPI0035BC5AEB